MRTNWALLAALLCYAAAPAATCDPRDQLSPFNEPDWTLVEPNTTLSRVLVAPNSMTQQAMQMTDATVILNARLAFEKRPVEETTVPTNALPSTSTAPDREPESGLR